MEIKITWAGGWLRAEAGFDLDVIDFDDNFIPKPIPKNKLYDTSSN
jgi:hypothetical protein